MDPPPQALQQFFHDLLLSTICTFIFLGLICFLYHLYVTRNDD